MPNNKKKKNKWNNNKFMRNSPSKNAKQCNYQQKENCPMNGAESLVHYMLQR